MNVRHSPAAAEMLDQRCLTLPGGVYGEDGILHRQVRVRELTGADEETLFDTLQASGSRRVSNFLARAIESVAGLDTPIDPDFTAGLQIGDRDYLLLRLRQMDLGDAVHQIVRCPSCASKVDVDLLISELPVRRLDHPKPAWPLHVATESADFDLLLRLPTGADQEAVETLALVNPAAANTRLFSRLVIDVNGHGAPDEAQVRNWPLALRARLAAWIEEQAPGPELFLDLSCPYCNADMSYAFDINGFFLTSG
jgi:hypothetical protein